MFSDPSLCLKRGQVAFLNRWKNGRDAIPREGGEEFFWGDGNWRRLQAGKVGQESDDLWGRVVLTKRTHVETAIALGQSLSLLIA